MPRGCGVTTPKRHRVRKEIARQQGWKCWYCDRLMDKRGGTHKRVTGVTLDHIHPRARGGTDDRWNLVAACYSCNQAKGDRLPEERGAA